MSHILTQGSTLQGDFASQCANLVRPCRVLEPDRWPPAENKLLRFVEEEIVELCERFRETTSLPGDLMPLLNCVKSLRVQP